MTVGLISSVVLAMIGPAMRGADALWPLVNPTVVSLPLGFLGAVLGTFIGGRDRENEKRFDRCRFTPASHQTSVVVRKFSSFCRESLNPKFAKESAAKCCELRIRHTRSLTARQG